MIIAKDSTSITTYFVMRLTASGQAATSITITDIDLQYCRSGAAPSTKVDATALASAGAAWSANKAFEVDATDQPGLIRVDWPDAAFATGVNEVILTVKLAGSFTEHLRVELSPAVDAIAISKSTTAANNLELQYDTTGLSGSTFPATQGEVSVLATAAKLLAYTQLLVRSDAAITADNATELSEINADGGSGVGDYAATTDSQEAIRDWGDSSWITFAGAGGVVIVCTLDGTVYAARTDIEQIYGADNVSKWADLDNDENPTTITTRINRSLTFATNEINDTLRGGRYVLPITDLSAAVTLVDLCATMAGVWLYESRGVEDFDPETGRSVHKLVFMRDRAKKKLEAIRANRIQLDVELTTQKGTAVPRAIK